MQLHILHAVEKTRLSTGSVVQMLEAARGLTRRGHRVTVVSRSAPELTEACTEAGITQVTLPLSNPFDLRSTLWLRRHLRRDPAQVIHVHKGRCHALALWAATGLGPLPVVVVNRGVSYPLELWNRWKYLHPRVGAVVCVAEAVRQIVIGTTGAGEEKVLTIHAGTDIDRFDPAAVDSQHLRRELGVSDRQLLVGQVSVRDGKGWRDLLAAFARVATARPDARLLLIGCEPEEELHKVESVAASYGIGKVVLTLPYRRDMPQVLAGCDVVVDASWQGTGITGVIREAMAMERAVVATDCAGNRELVTDGEVGFLVPPRDIAALARALLRLLGDAILREHLGRSARQRVVREFSTTARIEQLEALYLRLVNQRRGRQP